MALSTFLTLALATLAAASPAPKQFSFAQWAREIAQDPSGQHLSPEQAIEAFANNTANVQARAANFAGGCGNLPSRPAYGPDAVWCTNYLAGLGDQRCEASQPVITMCSYHGATVSAALGPNTNYDTTPCRHVAEVVGSILDNCYDNANQRVQGWAPSTGSMIHSVYGP